MTTRATMASRRISWLLPAAASVLLLAGCFTDPDIEYVVAALEWELQPAELDPEVELRFGRGTLGLARFLCEFSDDCEEWGELLAEVDQVHVGVYDVRGARFSNGLRMSDELRGDLVYDDWQLIVSVHDEHDSTFILANADEDRIYDILVISFDGDQAVVVRLKGDLGEALHHLVHERSNEFADARTWKHDS